MNAVEDTSHAREDSAADAPRNAEARQASPSTSDEDARVILLVEDNRMEVPMVALSAKKKEEFGPALDELGIRPYFEKPIDPFAVVKHVLRSLDSAAPRGSHTHGE